MFTIASVTYNVPSILYQKSLYVMLIVLVCITVVIQKFTPRSVWGLRWWRSGETSVA